MASYNGSLTYLGTAGVINNASGKIFKANIALGDVSLTAQAATSGTTRNLPATNSNDIFEKVDVRTGSVKAAQNVYSAVNTRAPGNPSGYDQNRSATYGDGQTNVSTTFNTDTAVSGLSTLNIGKSGKNTKYFYANLTN